MVGKETCRNSLQVPMIRDMVNRIPDESRIRQSKSEHINL
jgi:hypothetical protein